VTSQPRAFFTLDLGSATTSAALVGHVGGRWRLIAHTSAPASLDVDGVLVGLLSRVELTDPELLAELAGVERPTVTTLVATWPRLEARTTPPRRIAVLAGSRRQRRRLEEVALRAGWLVSGGSADEMDLVALSRVVLSTQTAAVLLGADHSPGGDERRHLPDLAALTAAAKRLRPELTVILAGGAAAFESTFAGATDIGPAHPLAADPESRLAVVPVAAVRPPEVADPLEAAAPQASAPPVGADDPGAEATAWVADVPAPDDKVEGQSKASPESPPAADVPTSPVLAAGRDSAASTSEADRSVSPQILLAPDAGAGEPAGASLQQVLEGLRALPNDSRLGVARSIGSLAYVLDRVVEVVEIGLQGGLRARSEPIGGGHSAVVSSHACFANASFSPADPSEETIDSVFAWSTTALDRHRLTDRLHDLRLVPWGDGDGDGAAFRLAAAKAAFSRLVDATAEMTASPMPALTVAAGGIFASLPPSVVALAIADLGRRPGIGQLVCDEARMLGPLGAVEDEAERRRLLANLADDILVPLGCLVLPAGVKSGRTAGRLRLQWTEAISEIELHPGAIQVVDLPPGRTAKAEFDFRDSVRLGTRGHHFSVDVGGGLCGLLVDLRDIPLRMSDRAESRRAALDAWQRGMWPGLDE
jgi:hypothetical protein